MDVERKVECKIGLYGEDKTMVFEVFLIEHETYKDDAIENKHHGFEESKTSHFCRWLFRLWRKKGEEALLKVIQTILRALLSAFVIYHYTFTICIFKFRFSSVVEAIQQQFLHASVICVHSVSHLHDVFHFTWCLYALLLRWCMNSGIVLGRGKHLPLSRLLTLFPLWA